MDITERRCIVRISESITMNKLHHVIGYNFLPGGEIALQSARVLAEQSGAALHILHVVEPHPIMEQSPSRTLPAQSLQEEIVLKIRAQLKELTERSEFSPLHVTTEVHIGKPFVELISVCQQRQGDLIVVGVSEEGEGWFLGSTAERVLRKAPVPVLIAKRLLRNAPQTILIPTDFSTCAKQAAEEALTFVRKFGGRVVFLHVLEQHYLYPPAYGVAPMLWQISPETIEPEWQEFLRELPLGGDLKWEEQTREGPAAQTITAIVKEIGADMIVMGTHGRTGLTHMLIGSVAEQVVRTAECSVLTIRPNAFHFELP